MSDIPRILIFALVLCFICLGLGLWTYGHGLEGPGLGIEAIGLIFGFGFTILALTYTSLFVGCFGHT